jgi:hypothetical protein
MSETWVVHVDIFNVELRYCLNSDNAQLKSCECNCDIEKDVCRHVAIADSRVRAVFQDGSSDTLRGTILYAPRQWIPCIQDDCQPVACMLESE